jgi:hypothetical protein
MSRLLPVPLLPVRLDRGAEFAESSFRRLLLLSQVSSSTDTGPGFTPVRLLSRKFPPVDNTYLVVDTPQLTFTNDPDECLTEVAMRGRWDDDLRTRTSRGLRACIAETPRALIVNLSELIDPAGASASTWRTAGRYATTRQAAINPILCAVPTQVLRRLHNGSAVSGVTVVGTTADARALAQRAPWTPYRRRLTLSVRDNAASAGRTMAGDACVAWNLTELSHPARAIMSELLTNAVDHAGAAMMASVSVRGDVLHLAVQDGHSGLPRVIEAAPYRPGEAVGQQGAGLRLVKATANAWGALPCRVGKVVWATLVRELVAR